jgi:hypothetical protein
VSFVAITLCVASQRVYIVVVVVYLDISSVRKLLDNDKPNLTQLGYKGCKMDRECNSDGNARNMYKILLGKSLRKWTFKETRPARERVLDKS